MHKYYRTLSVLTKDIILCTQSVRDFIIGSLGITDLSGLENLGSFDELSIVNNQYLATLRTLGQNLPAEYRATVSNLGIRDNPLLADCEGLWFVERVEGACFRM